MFLLVFHLVHSKKIENFIVKLVLNCHFLQLQGREETVNPDFGGNVNSLEDYYPSFEQASLLVLFATKYKLPKNKEKKKSELRVFLATLCLKMLLYLN